MERHDWFGWERVEAPRATREQLERVHPPAHVDADRGALGARRRRDRPRHDGRRRHVRGGAAGGRRGGRARRRAAGRRRRRAASRRCGRPATTPRRRGRWASASSTTSPSAAAHARAAHGAERVLILDWDVHHGNGTNDIFHADPSVLFCSIHEWPLYPGTGPADDVGSGAGEGFTVNLPVPGRLGRRGARARSSSTSSRR